MGKGRYEIREVKANFQSLGWQGCVEGIMNKDNNGDMGVSEYPRRTYPFLITMRIKVFRIQLFLFITTIKGYIYKLSWIPCSFFNFKAFAFWALLKLIKKGFECDIPYR